MANLYIKPLYKRVYNEEFEYHDFAKRMKMQKCIYLVEQFGINVGEYDFSWYKHGPYSQKLQDDMYAENRQPTVELRYSDFADSVISKICEMVEYADMPGFFYTKEMWMECLASVHYLNRIFQGDRNRTLHELTLRKPHLNDKELNSKAYLLVTSRG